MVNPNQNPYCSSHTAPIDITQDAKICQATCNYMPKYKTSAIKFANMGEYLKITLDTDNKSAQFNNVKYKVKEIRVYNRSLHTYSGNDCSGEFLIIHEQVDIVPTPELLIVAIPIFKSNMDTLATLNLETIITEAIKDTPKDSLSTTHSTGSSLSSSQVSLNTINFNLENFVPKTTM